MANAAAKDGFITIVTKGAWKNGLFSIECPDCLKHVLCCGCYCYTIKQIHEKLGPNMVVIAGPEISPTVAAVASICCMPCELFAYGKKFKGPLEPLPVACFKVICCGSCYLHQQAKEPTAMGAVIGAAGAAAGQAASLVGARMGGSPSQQEMK